MDREKVIRALENCTDKIKCRDCPWEPCDDFDYTHSEYPDGLIKDALELLKAQEPKHGQWITDGDRMICSVCENVPFNQVKLNDKMIYNMDIGNMMKYCPICGARMDGDADGAH